MTVTPYADHIEHLQGALHVLNLRLHRRVLQWRADHHPGAAPDELAGLFISDANIDHLLKSLYPSEPAPGARVSLELLDRLIEQQASTHHAREAAAVAAGIPLRLPRLADRLGLSAFEQQVILLGAAAETDRRYERLFGYLNDDLTQKAPTAALAAMLFCAAPAERLAALQVFTADAPLRARRLIHLTHEAGTLAARGFRLDERIAAFLLGAQPFDPTLENLVEMDATSPELPVLAADTIEAVVNTASFLQNNGAVPLVVNLYGTDAHLQRRTAAFLAAGFADAVLWVDADALAAALDPQDAVARLQRDCLLLGGALAIHDPGAQLPRRLLARLTSLAQPCMLLTESVWQAPDAAVLRLHLPAPDTEAQQQIWAAALAGTPLDAGVSLLELADRFRLNTGQITAAAGSARLKAAVEPERASLDQNDLFAICREQIGRELGSLAQRLETHHTWDDLILPAPVKTQLMALEDWVRHRHQVLQLWQFGRQTGAHGGLSALFSGPSGTGKTLSAGILGHNLGLDVFRIDLSAVVSKYIGETEKNLERIFTLAEAANAVLFFDEADALFGKRSEVHDAHDRYANIEVSYLLQRMEAYPGIAILATNLKQNFDAAFLRRLQVTVEFPFPNADERERLWRALIPPEAPIAQDIDFGWLAKQFSLTGGNIKNCVLYAAYTAASAGEPIQMRDLVRAVARELEKLEQPVLRSEFGAYYDLARLLDGNGTATEP